MYWPTRAKRGEKSGDLNSRKLHKRFLELRSYDLLGGRLALMTTSDRHNDVSPLDIVAEGERPLYYLQRHNDVSLVTSCRYYVQLDSSSHSVTSRAHTLYTE